MTLRNILKSDTDNLWLLYYLLLGIIQASWTNMGAFPPALLRYGMIIAVFAPLFFKPYFTPFALMYSITVNRYLATKYTYLPTEINLYLYILVPLLIIHRKSLHVKLSIPLKIFIFMAVYWWMIDLLNLGEFGTYVKFCIIPIISALFITEEKSLHLLSAGFIMACTILAVYYYLNFDKFLVTWNRTEQLERSGWCDPNYFSTTLAIGYMFAMMYLFGVIKSTLIIFRPIFLALSCTFIALAIVMLASRAGFLCILIITMIFLFRSKIKLKWFFLAISFIALVVGYMFVNGYFEVLLFRLFEQGNTNDAGGRTGIWFDVINNHFYQDFFKIVFGGGYWNRVNLTGGYETHNEAVAIFADYGIVGILMYVYFLIKLTSNRKHIIIPLFMYILIVFTLSPFQYPTISFFLVWISMAKNFNLKLA